MADETDVGVEAPAKGLASESGRCTDHTAQTIHSNPNKNRSHKGTTKDRDLEELQDTCMEKGYNHCYNVTM